MTKAFKAKVGNPLRKLVLIKLADNANDQGVSYPSYQYVAEQCEISRRSVIEHVKALQDMGVLAIKHRIKDGQNRSNSFQICAKKLDQLSSAVVALDGEGAALGSANGAKKRASDSPPLVKELHPEPPLSNRNITTTTESGTGSGGCDLVELVFDENLTDDGKEILGKVQSSNLSADTKQAVLDELAAAIRHGKNGRAKEISLPVRYLAAILKRAIAGEFTPDLGKSEAKRRETLAKNQRNVQKTAEKEVFSSDEDNMAIKLISQHKALKNISPRRAKEIMRKIEQLASEKNNDAIAYLKKEMHK
jgi:biotin operon repressor